MFTNVIKKMFAVVLIVALTGCGITGNWQVGKNIITEDNRVEFYNGISIEYQAGSIHTLTEAHESEVEGKKIYTSTYKALTADEQFAYTAIQLSGHNAFAKAITRKLSEPEFIDFTKQITDTILEQIRQSDPDVTVIGSELKRDNIKSQSGTQFVVGDFKYSMSSKEVNADVFIKVIIDKNNMQALMSMDDSNGSFVDAQKVLDSVKFK